MSIDHREQGRVSTLIVLGIILLVVLALTGCSTTAPITQKFPEVPEELLKSCGPLQALDTNTKRLSDVLTAVTDNYSKFHECKIKNDAWIDWYNSNKKIHDSVK
jgi:hypothetical protein